MQVVEARNVHQALPEVMHLLKTQGVHRDSRNGPVLKVDGPATIMYRQPRERVMFWPERDANPFFHMLEALWMLAGRNDLAFVASILPSMANFSDDGATFHGAYGHRWRCHFNFDQLFWIVDALQKNPDDRRQVLQIWDVKVDLNRPSGRDLPCNTHVYFAVNEGKLDMTVCNRSNDAVWGALGANAVHFSILQEYMAVQIGCEVGRYWQVTNNLHLYLDIHTDLMETMAARAFPSRQYKISCPYEQNIVTTTPLIPSGDHIKFDRDVRMLLDEGDAPLGTGDWFVRRIASQMLRAIKVYKDKTESKKKRLVLAQNTVSLMPSNNDWTLAAQEWLARRAK